MAGESYEGNESAGRSEVPVASALWTPQPGPQLNAICADWCPLLFYGGGKFSGKSDFLLGDYLQDIETYREHWQGIIFRRALTEFTELKLRAREIFPKLGGEWKEKDSQWVFPKYGRKVGDTLLMPILRFKYLERLEDIRLYEGHSYPWIGVDELGDWEDPAAFFRLLTCNRYGRHPIPNKRVRATGNPGGRGHGWISDYFVSPAPLGSELLYDEVLKIPYMFILGTYRDNKIGMENDPGYADRLNRAGSPALVRALKEGDFTVVAGAFFTEFTQGHVIQPFQIPKHWLRFQSMDWGSCGEGDPFSVGWWAMSDGNDLEGKIPYFPRGHLIRYREWYGKGLHRISVDELAEGIKERELGDTPVTYRTAGGDIKRKTDAKGPSVFEQLSEHGLHFIRSDMDRVAGWLKMRGVIKGKDTNIPGCSVFSNCTSTIKIIPAVQHSKRDANDIEESNDDLPDEWRYALMSRPWITEAPSKEVPLHAHFPTPTINELWERRDQMLGRRR